MEYGEGGGIEGGFGIRGGIEVEVKEWREMAQTCQP